MRTVPGAPTWRVVSWLGVVLLSGCAAHSPLHPTTPQTVSGLTAAMQANEEEKKLLEHTNALRLERGPHGLRAESRLMEAARRHAGEMVRRDRYGDTDANGHILDGMDHGARVQKAGYAFARVAENVGWQIARPDPVARMMSDWIHSPGHRRNLLIPEVTEVGVGAARGKSGRWYFVQIIAKPFESTRRSTSRMMSQVAGHSTRPG